MGTMQIAAATFDRRASYYHAINHRRNTLHLIDKKPSDTTATPKPLSNRAQITSYYQAIDDTKPSSSTEEHPDQTDGLLTNPWKQQLKESIQNNQIDKARNALISRLQTILSAQNEKATDTLIKHACKYEVIQKIENLLIQKIIEYRADRQAQDHLSSDASTLSSSLEETRIPSGIKESEYYSFLETELRDAICKQYDSSVLPSLPEHPVTQVINKSVKPKQVGQLMDMLQKDQPVQYSKESTKKQDLEIPNHPELQWLQCQQEILEDAIETMPELKKKYKNIWDQSFKKPFKSTKETIEQYTFLEQQTLPGKSQEKSLQWTQNGNWMAHI